MKTVTIPASKFKAECLQLMDDTQQKNMRFIITKYGKPVAELGPAKKEKPRQSFGWMKGTVHIIGDIISPTGEEWNADR